MEVLVTGAVGNISTEFELSITFPFRLMTPNGQRDGWTAASRNALVYEAA